MVYSPIQGILYYPPYFPGPAGELLGLLESLNLKEPKFPFLQLDWQRALIAWSAYFLIITRARVSSVYTRGNIYVPKELYTETSLVIDYAI